MAAPDPPVYSYHGNDQQPLAVRYGFTPKKIRLARSRQAIAAAARMVAAGMGAAAIVARGIFAEGSEVRGLPEDGWLKPESFLGCLEG